MRTETSQTVQRIAKAIEPHCVYSKTNLLRNQRRRLSGSEIYSMLSADPLASAVVEGRSLWRSRGMVSDSWGGEIIVEIRKEGLRSHCIRVLSRGPNQKDDNGLADDLVSELYLDEKQLAD